MFVYPFNKFVTIWGKPIIMIKKVLSQNISIVQNELDRVTMLSKIYRNDCKILQIYIKFTFPLIFFYFVLRFFF